MTNTLVLVLQEFGQLRDGAMIEAVGEQFLDFLDGRIIDLAGIEQLVDSPLVRAIPAFDPVAEVEAAVGAEVAIGRQNGPDELLAIDEFE